MQAQKYAIKDWAIDDRPREKLLSKSPSGLSDSELLAILIVSGPKGKNAIDVAQEVLRLGRNNLDQLGRVSVHDLMKIKGIGMAKAISIAAALELGRRRQVSAFLKKTRVRNSKDAAIYLRPLLKDLNYEVFGVLFLNRSNRINHFEVLSRGGITGTIADPRIVMRKALEADAVTIVITHNHPSGSLSPSKSDKEVTAKIKEAARYFDIKLMDHIIISNEGYYSFADNDIL